MHKLAHENSIIYDRGINAPGHGKIIIDGINGTDKGDLEKEFHGNVEYQPEALAKGNRSILMFQMEDGQKRDLTDLCFEILSRVERSTSV